MKTRHHFDYIIVGSGPAGVQLAYFMEKSGKDYLVLESGKKTGTFFGHFPRHRKLISINKVYTGYRNKEINLRWDWNSLLTEPGEELLFHEYTKDYFPGAEDFLTYLQDFAKTFRLRIQHNSRVRVISRNSHFAITDTRGRKYSCNRLIIATGVSKPYIPDIPGIELCDNYGDVSVRPNDFKDQKVLILGKGNSALETAENLIPTASVIHVCSPNPVRLAWKTHYVGDLRAINNNFLDTYQLKSQNAMLDANVTRIHKKGNHYVVSVAYTHADREEEDLVYDRVIVCTGFRFDDSIFDRTCRPKLAIRDRFPEQTSGWESTNIKDLYFAGTLSQMRAYRKSQSGFIHGFRYNVRALDRMLDRKYHDKEWPGREIAATPKAISETLMQRINSSSGLWQQFGYLVDVVVVSRNGKATYYEEVPYDYVQDSGLDKGFSFYTAGLEFGKSHAEPFETPRHPNPARAEESTFLHPVICFHAPGASVKRLHLLENLYGEWKNPEQHVGPLQEFLTNCSQRVSTGYSSSMERVAQL